MFWKRGSGMDFSDEIKEAAEKLAKTVPDFTKTDSVSVDK